MQTPPPLAGRLQGSSTGMKDVALPQGDRAPNCVTPASRQEDATQFWYLLRGSQRCQDAGRAKFRRQTGTVLYTQPGLTLLQDGWRTDAVRRLTTCITASLQRPRCQSEKYYQVTRN